MSLSVASPAALASSSSPPPAPSSSSLPLSRMGAVSSSAGLSRILPLPYPYPTPTLPPPHPPPRPLPRWFPSAHASAGVVSAEQAQFTECLTPGLTAAVGSASASSVHAQAALFPPPASVAAIGPRSKAARIQTSPQKTKARSHRTPVITEHIGIHHTW